MSVENWKSVKGYEGLYEVSDQGNVRSLDREVTHKNGNVHTYRGRMITPHAGTAGNLGVFLYKNGESASFKVHRLVAEAFLENPDSLPYVIHLNEQHEDNRAENLAYSADHQPNRLPEDYVTIAMRRAMPPARPDVVSFDHVIWRDVECYDGVYEVSSDGRVRSVDRWVDRRGTMTLLEGKELSAPRDEKGYPRVCLYKDGKPTGKKVHRLVAEAFIPNPDNLPCVDHRNAVKHDNRVENLRWCTSRDNTVYAYELGIFDREEKANHMRSEEFRRRQAKAVSKPVIRSDGKRYDSINDAAEDTGCNRHAISNVLHGRQKKAHGFSFAYVED